MTSHYSRKDAQQKRFLNPNLNIMWMYNLIYLEAMESEVLEREKDIIRARQERRPIPEKLKLAVGEHTYRKVFNSEFNLRFGLPCLDTCATCDRLNLALKSDPGAQLPISSWWTTKIRKTKGIKINYAGRQKRGPLIAGEAIPVLYALLPTIPKTLWMWYLSTSCKTFPCQI